MLRALGKGKRGRLKKKDAAKQNCLKHETKPRELTGEENFGCLGIAVRRRIPQVLNYSPIPVVSEPGIEKVSGFQLPTQLTVRKLHVSKGQRFQNSAKVTFAAQ